MSTKQILGLIFGGRSAEHEVSLISARNIYAAIDRSRYEIILIGIAKDGTWHQCPASVFDQSSNNPLQMSLDSSGARLALSAGIKGAELYNLDSGAVLSVIDVVFPVLHGTFGEDGTMQGLLKLAGVPFVGPGVLGSAVAMDKDLAKRLLSEAGIPNSPFVTIRREERKSVSYSAIVETLGLPLFIKPANLGSSVGIHKVKDESSFWAAIDDAFSFDRKIIIEQCIVGKEIEVAVLGNEYPRASLPGRVITTAQHEFYSYQAKYVDEKGADIEIPTPLPQASIKHLQDLAVKTFKVLSLEGMSRVDFFLTEDGTALVNEVNTIPGFTAISMYPKLWEASGLPYRDLIQQLIDLAVERHQLENGLRTSVN